MPNNKVADPSSYIEASVETLRQTLVGKNQDYTGGRGEFFNFEKAASFAGLDALDVMYAQIGIKVTRLEALMGQEYTNYESLPDSLLDLAGYALIAHARLESMRSVATPIQPVAMPTWDPAG